MELAELVKIAVQQGGFAVIALFIFAVYRKDVKGTADVLIMVVRENTQSNTQLITVIEALHRRLDHEPDVHGRRAIRQN